MAITPPQIDTIELINRVASFYELAWSHMLWFIGVAGAIIGIVIPIAIQVYQRRAFKMEESRIESRITERFMNEKSAMLSSVNEKLEEVIKSELERIQMRVDEMEDDLTKKVNQAKGAVYHIQGNNLSSQDFPAVAITSFIDAAEMMLSADDELNLQTVLNNLGQCLQKISKVEIEKRPDIELRTTSLIEKLSKNNPNGRYTNYINNIERQLRNAKNREKKVEQKPA